jgi:hypothetical protein
MLSDQTDKNGTVREAPSSQMLSICTYTYDKMNYCKTELKPIE